MTDGIRVNVSGGPCDGYIHTIRTDAKIGERFQVHIAAIFDPDRPVYLPYDDIRNSPAEDVAVYLYDGNRLVVP